MTYRTETREQLQERCNRLQERLQALESPKPAPGPSKARRILDYCRRPFMRTEWVIGSALFIADAIVIAVFGGFYPLAVFGSVLLFGGIVLWNISSN